MHHKRLFRDGNSEENKPKRLGQLRHRNPRHVLSCGVCGQWLSAAPRGALSASFGQRAAAARDNGQCGHQTSRVPCSAPRVSEAPGCFTAPVPPAVSLWVFQPGPWAEPATACPTASPAPAALPWPPQLPPESSWVGSAAAFPVVQEAEDIISLSAEGTALFLIISVKIIWHGAMLSCPIQLRPMQSPLVLLGCWIKNPGHAYQQLWRSARGMELMEAGV